MLNPLKRVLERALLASGAAGLLGVAKRRAGLILSYHNIVPDGERPGGEQSLHLARRDFSTQLDLLQAEAEVVPLTALFTSAPQGHRPRVAITFDDAYRGTVTAGVDELRVRGLPATIFVVPSFVGGRAYWWDAIACSERGLSLGARRHAIDICAGRDDAVRAWARLAGVPLHQPPAWSVTASEEELREALGHPGIALGSHTWSHPNLTCLNDGDLETELRRPLGWLQEHFSRAIPWLTYPYGRRDARVERFAERAGYIGALRVDGGWLDDSPVMFSLPRLNIPAGISPAGFRLRLAGLLCG